MVIQAFKQAQQAELRRMAGEAFLSHSEHTSRLDQALRDAAEARIKMDALTYGMELREAELTLLVQGKNEGERSARLTLALEDDASYQEDAEAYEAARRELLDADRRAAVEAHHCRRELAMLTFLAATSERQNGG